jgi:Leucine-rich repeat (LRR) protein
MSTWSCMLAGALSLFKNLLEFYISNNDIEVSGEEHIAAALHHCRNIAITDGISAPRSAESNVLLDRRDGLPQQRSVADISASNSPSRRGQGDQTSLDAQDRSVRESSEAPSSPVLAPHPGRPLADPSRSPTEWLLSEKITLIYQVSFVSNCLRREHLRKVDLSRNNLGRNEESLLGLCKALGHLTSVTDLGMSDNAPFSNGVCAVFADSMRAMKSLNVLKLGHNSISSQGAAAIACALVVLCDLETLDISNNRFTELPVGLANACPHLTRINALGNPWLEPPAEIMHKNTFQIMDYLNDLYHHGEWNRCVSVGQISASLPDGGKIQG